MSPESIAFLPVAPGGTVGILGGGQLGRMLALAAAGLGLKTHIYSDDNDAPAFQVCTARTVAKFDDKGALSRFAQSCDVVTLEFENVPAESLEHVGREKPVAPCASALRITQDRFAEKSFVRSLGLKTAEFFSVNSIEDACTAFSALDRKAVLKTRHFGYDGKGQAKVSNAEECMAALRASHGRPSILESFVDFSFEASIVVARGRDGSFAAYDPPENIHEDHILRRSLVPGRVLPAQNAEAKSLAREIAEALDYVGVLAIELFVMKDGTLVINEIAPRVHNSGHWTIEACAVSQFEQHIRAVAGWPLGDPARHANATMQNIIGEEASQWQRLAQGGGALHLYGKSEIRPGRKMGHLTLLSPLTKN